MEELLEENNILRAEANIRTDFPAAIKLVEHLGFELEGTMRCQLPDGSDSYLYSKIRKGEYGRCI